MHSWKLLFFCALFFNSHTNCHKNPGHLKPFGSQGPHLTVDEVNSLSTVEFFEKYVNTKKAVVLRDATKQFAATKLWTDEYLYKKTENLNDYMFDVETVKKETRNQKMLQMTFREFLDSYRKKELYMVSDVSSVFMDELNLPQVLQCGHANKGLDKMVMWFSSGNTKSVIHTDDYENILCIIDGKKDVVLVDSNKYEDEAQALIDFPDGAYSSADVDKVDYDKYPRIENMEYYKATLNKGDCLYIPFKWIHQVRSTNRNLAVNYWFNNEKLFELGQFPESCKTNKFDPAQTLDSLDLFNEEEVEDVGQFTNFKYWLIRQITSGKNKYPHWVELLVEEHLPKNMKIEDFPEVEEYVGEFFNTLDYDGSGEITGDELRQIDINRLEHMANIFEELDAILQKVHSDLNESSKEEL